MAQAIPPLERFWRESGEAIDELPDLDYRLPPIHGRSDQGGHHFVDLGIGLAKHLPELEGSRADLLLTRFDASLLSRPDIARGTDIGIANPGPFSRASFDQRFANAIDLLGTLDGRSALVERASADTQGFHEFHLHVIPSVGSAFTLKCTQIPYKMQLIKPFSTS